MVQKGVLCLKRIILLIFLLLAAALPNVFATDNKVYDVGDYSNITLPEDWKTVIDSKGISAISPNYRILSDFWVSQKKYTSIDDEIKEIKSRSKNGVKVETVSNLRIDNRDARCMLSTDYSLKNIKQYYLTYIVYSQDYRYLVFFFGEYDNLDSDRKIVEEIVSNIKILK